MCIVYFILFFIFNIGDGVFLDGWVFVKNIFDFGWINVFVIGNVYFFDLAGDEVIVIFVELF